ncbi:alpha/beta fold hydrolase [Nocardioides sp. zg-536]|uniref:Alpha/beta fold hydrolase n=1 Tax=Nocardioides faecalis TaxID=2803858 RepID=A0A938Y8W5_9ACTN|nr:alpha/beta fold hydrolase [Nocardioides faecalis]MBM9461347.1 alpha/beta fold hydrolase [Nocardioides faecalis]QVI57616.1 alpha/beta fold hydrolase [Nocardioides faecalis]
MPSTTGSATAPLRVDARPELTGDRRIAVLLSHGFTGSPASMRPWGEHLAELGYGVRAPLLPGHGTTWQDLNRHTWAQWTATIREVFEELSATHDAVVVGGLSMGGAQVLRLAADVGDRVAGVMVVNPAVSTLRRDVRLLPVLKHVVPSFPAIGNDIKKAGMDESGYQRTPLKAVHSMMRAWPQLIADLPQVTAPLVYFRSATDNVVDDSSEPIILGRVSSTDVTRVPLPESYHVATLDNDAPTIFARSAEFVARVTG